MGGAAMPGGIMGIWSKNVWGGFRISLLAAAVGVAYQYSCNNDLSNNLYPSNDNPNIPTYQFFDQEWTFLHPTREEGRTYGLAERVGLNFSDPGPSWKKWEDAEK